MNSPWHPQEKSLAHDPDLSLEQPHMENSETNDKEEVPKEDQAGGTVGFKEGETQRESREKTLISRENVSDKRHSDWWWASTLFPLLGATLGPLANISSIAALVTSWREQVYINGEYVSELDGSLFADPKWCYWLNVVSLICGFLGNLFLLFNFTQRIRYLLALPATILFWYLASGLLIGITASMQVYTPPHRPEQTYTQGFWYAIVAAALYLLCSILLMINMLGYFIGRYPDTFVLSDSQRTLILQTMVFFIWLGGGAAIFSKIETAAGQSNWNFVNAIYFCDVTILTVGFGDFYPTTNVARGIVIPYSVGGIIILALIVNSIYKFMREIGEQNIIQKHTERIRVRTVDRAVTNSFDLRQFERKEHHLIRRRAGVHPKISMPTELRALRTPITEKTSSRRNFPPLALTVPKKIRKPRAILLREEKDRFHAMRHIQHRSRRFRKWMELAISVFAFGILWCVGAIVFWQAEKNTQGMSYFQALYFCYISLLTIGYGDLSPKSNAGRTFFVVWSLIAVPTITVLVSGMGDTVVHKFKKWSDELADFTVLPKHGIWRDFIEERALRRRLKRGFETVDPDITDDIGDQLRDEVDTDNQIVGVPTTSSDRNAVRQEDEIPASASASLGKRLAYSIARVAADLRHPTPKQYEYEEWVEFTQLIRLSRDAPVRNATGDEGEEGEGLVEWDWIGTESPMMSGMSEPEWLLHRLCESLVRIERRKEAFALQDRSHDSDRRFLSSSHDNFGDDDAEVIQGRAISRIRTV